MNKSTPKVLSIFAGLLVFWTVVALSLFLILSQTWLYPLFSKDRVNSAQLEEEVIQKNYKDLIRYNLLPGEKTLEFQGLPMSPQGHIHFEEVKAIFQKVLWTGVIALGLSVLLARRVMKKGENPIFILYGCRISIILPLFVSFFMATNFDRAFILFHHLFFNNNYWLFDPEKDPIINYLPESFFMFMAIGFLVLYLLILALTRWGLYPRLNPSRKKPANQ